MNIILFGPPGIGKSTIIGKLKNLGASAIDLEDLYPNKVRFQIPNLVSNAFIGAADLNPKRGYRGARKVLLIAEQDVYDARRAKRDSAHPGKGSQAHHSIDDWNPEGTEWDRVLYTDGQSPEQTADILYSWMRRWK